MDHLRNWPQGTPVVRAAIGPLPVPRAAAGVALPHAHHSADSCRRPGRIRTARAAHSARLAVHDIVRHRDGARGHRRARAHHGRRGLGRDRHGRGTAVLERVHAGRMGCRRALADPRAASIAAPSPPRTSPASSSPSKATAWRRRVSSSRSSTQRCGRRVARSREHLGATRDRIPSGVSVGIQQDPGDARGGRGRLPRRGLRAHQAQDQARPRHRRDGAPCARRSAASRSRSTRTPPTRSPTSTRSPSSTASICCSSSSRCRRTTSSTTPRSRGTCAPPSASMSRSCRSRPRRDALALGAASVINIKAGRVGGYLEAVGIHDLCRDAGRAGVVRRHARDRHRARGERGARRPPRLHAARATSRRRAASTTATS